MDDIFGTIKAPAGVAKYNEGGFGLMLFISNLIKIGTVIAGLWVMFNFLYAGYIYLTSSGDTSAHKKVTDLLTMSVIGLLIIITSYTIAAIIGLVFFGRADFILNPTISGVSPEALQ